MQNFAKNPSALANLTPEHQDYLLLNPDGYTCHFIRPDWKLPRRKSA